MDKFKRTFLLTALSIALSVALGAQGCDCDKDDDPEPAGGEESTGEMGGVGGPGQDVFIANCVACHTIGGGDRIGPDLRNVHQRRDADWLARWIDDPINMSKNDPIGRELFAQFQETPMPKMNLTAEEIAQTLEFMEAQSGEGAFPQLEQEDIELSAAEMTQAQQIYFDRCSGCHGTLRAGATGPNIQPERTTKIGSQIIRNTLTNGTPAGMPAWGRLGILSETEIDLMAKFVQLPPPTPPAHPMSAVRETWNLSVPVADRPTSPPAGRDWENYFGVILRDAGKVAILDGDSREVLAVLDTGFAVHILRSSSTGRYFYAVGRDGRLTMIDLWTETPTIVSQVRGCVDARSVDASKYEGYEDRFIIEGCYWPPQYVVYDGLTLEPKIVVDVSGSTFDTNEPLDEVRVAAIIASHHDPVWILALKESGHVGIVDYSQEGFPMVRRIAAERFLHDGGWDHTGRYFMVAANMRNTMAVIDVDQQSLVTTFQVGIKPHPGRGANWEDPEFGWVNATSHIGQALFAVYGADPAENPEHAWKVVRSIELPSSGSLFIKTHPNSKWVWLDFALSSDDDQTRQVCVYSKAEGEIHRCWAAADRGRVVHFEYNRAGTEVWTSGWDNEGQLIIYNDETLEEVQRVTGDWLVAPTGKFNVYNTAHDVY